MTAPRPAPATDPAPASATAPPPWGELLALVPGASADPAVLGAARTDRSGWSPPGRPAVVVRAAGVDDVRAVLRFATAHRVPVVTRGAGSGLAGGAVADTGSIVLDLSGMDRVLRLDPAEQVVVVEPGVVLADLDRAAAEHGLRYQPDPGSVAIATVGGSIATNAGGLRAAKHGVTRDAVLALDVVLADGTLLSTGSQTIKGVSGYDLTSLLVGSEGTLGVVVGATLRLHPVPVRTATAAAFFPSATAAAAAAAAVIAAGVQPAVLELVDGPTLRAVDAVQGTALAGRGEAFLLAQTDGWGAHLEMERLVEVLAPLASDLSTTEDPVVAEELTTARRLALPSLERLGRVLVEDIAVPRSRMAEAVEEVQVIARRHGVQIFTVAHAGDGNLHPILLVGPSAGPGEPGEEVPATVWAAADDVFALALRLGGTLTGEHGVGLLKRSWLERELGSDSLALQHRIREVFDPAGILNPGKAL